ncbi:MAG: (Fe-S)-binding protein [Opitutales bacterium]|nr:(Fe-S)-binding protein [Opitutales bacterium]MBT6769626.1 (Fe-S)-binding protein [Opitutales bacterium]
MPEDAPSLRLQSLDYSVLQQCMHCGMCLPTCPTYDTTGIETNSPRGRISLMRTIADGELELSKTFSDEMYYCLGCLACTSACPAGVDYAHMFEAARADIEDHQLLDTSERRFWRSLSVKFIFMRPKWLRFIGSSMRFYQQSGLQNLLRKIGFMKLLPKNLQELEPMTPTIQDAFTDEIVAESESPASTKPTYKVGMLSGCVQDIAFSDVNRDTVDVLLANNCEVITPRNQGCCGSLHSHNGEIELAKDLARKAIDSFDLDKLDAIISNAGGCGSHLRHYGRLLSDDPQYAKRAHQWDSKVKDIHEWLMSIDLRELGPLATPAEITYHPSCHLYHGQKVMKQPSQLLASIPNVTLKVLKEADWCCGSAGVYNITQPEQAKLLQDRKVDNIKATGCKIVATSNPGCHLQIQNGLGSDYCVRHPISILAEAYRNT